MNLEVFIYWIRFQIAACWMFEFLSPRLRAGQRLEGKAFTCSPAVKFHAAIWCSRLIPACFTTNCTTVLQVNCCMSESQQHTVWPAVRFGVSIWSTKKTRDVQICYVYTWQETFPTSPQEFVAFLSGLKNIHTFVFIFFSHQLKYNSF